MKNSRLYIYIFGALSLLLSLCGCSMISPPDQKQLAAEFEQTVKEHLEKGPCLKIQDTLRQNPGLSDITVQVTEVHLLYHNFDTETFEKGRGYSFDYSLEYHCNDIDTFYTTEEYLEYDDCKELADCLQTIYESDSSLYCTFHYKGYQLTVDKHKNHVIEISSDDHNYMYYEDGGPAIVQIDGHRVYDSFYNLEKRIKEREKEKAAAKETEESSLEESKPTGIGTLPKEDYDSDSESSDSGTETSKPSDSGSKQDSPKRDVYDVYDYDDPDDFADDMEYEFDSYDDAYEYWEDHH